MRVGPKDLKVVNITVKEKEKNKVGQTGKENKELQTTTEELEYSKTESERFAYVASHALREPLHMVTSHTQLLAQRYKG